MASNKLISWLGLFLAFYEMTAVVHSGANSYSPQAFVVPCSLHSANTGAAVVKSQTLRLRSVRCQSAQLVQHQREDLNRIQIKREMVYQNIKRKIRASSYEFGAQNLRRTFSLFDVDKDGFLDLFEFRRVVRQLGINSELLSDLEIEIVLQEIGGEGLVSVEEFIRWLGRADQDTSTATGASLMTRSLGWTYGESEPSLTAHSTVSTYSYGRTLDPAYTAAIGATVDVPTVHGLQQHPNVRSSYAIDRMERGLDWNSSIALTLIDCSSTQLQDVKYFLTNEVGIPSDKILSLATKAPEIFSLNVDSNLRPSLDYLLQMGIPNSKLAKIVMTFPQFFTLSKARKDEVIEFLKQLGISESNLSKCFCSHPQVFGLSVDGKMRKVVQFLVSEGGIPLTHVGQLVATFPTVLGYSVEHNLRPKVMFLCDELLLPKDKVGAMVLKFPQILSLSMSTNIRPSIQYMISELGIGSEEVAKIVQQHPQLLGLNVESNIKPKVEYLKRELGIEAGQLSKVVKAFPTLLSLSIDMNLRPKVAYLMEEAGYSLSDIVRAPHLLGYSLENRIKPRIALANKAGLRLGLASLLSPSDSTFFARHRHSFTSPSLSVAS